MKIFKCRTSKAVVLAGEEEFGTGVIDPIISLVLVQGFNFFPTTVKTENA